MLWGPTQTLPAPAPSSLTASASGVPLPQQPAEPGGRAADAASPGGRTSPAPPCSRPPSREEEQAGLRPDPPSHPGPADRGLRPLAGSPRRSLEPCSIRSLPSSPSLHAATLFSLSALPTTFPPPGSLPYSAVPSHSRSQFPTSFPAACSVTWKQITRVERHRVMPISESLSPRSPSSW